MQKLKINLDLTTLNISQLRPLLILFYLLKKMVYIVQEIEYVGKIYTKIGFESFSALHKGYKDIHSAIMKLLWPILP